MNASIYRISLDIHEPYSNVSLDVKRGDTNRKIHIMLTDGGFPYHISEECYAVFTATKPDGNIVFNHCSIEGNTIIYELTPQTVAVEGLAECEVKLYGADDKLLTSSCFNLVVNETVYNEGDEIESEKEVDALTHLVSEAATVIYEGNKVNAESRELIQDLEAKQEELAQNVADAKASAESAKASEEASLRSMNAANNAAEIAAFASVYASDAEEAAKASETASKAAEEVAVRSAAEAKESEENAKRYSETIDIDQINANIEAKADDLYFDAGTSLLYLMSNGQVIGTGVQVATTGGGGGGGTLAYTISMKNLLDSRVITVSEGTKVELKFSYASVDDEGMDDGPGIGKIIVGNATRHTFTAKQGVNIIDVTGYLSAGSNTVKVQVENSEGAKKNLSYTVTVAAAYLTSNFDVSAPFTGPITFTYVPTGIAEKTVYFELDGEEIGTAIVNVSGRQQSYPIPEQHHGSHNLRVWFECEIEGTKVTSNILSFAIVCIEEGNTTPIIAVNHPTGDVEQYSNIVTKYRVYDPASMTAAITLEANGEVVQNLTVDRTEQTWTYRPMEVGELVQTIRCGTNYASWNRTVTESTIEVEAETEALALYLSSYGRSNSEENPGVWKSGNVEAEFQSFNFVSDGWLHDDEDNTVLRVTGDARLHIPYRMFAYDFRTTGKTIEFEMATRDVLNYDAEVINCFSGKRGFSITAQQLKLASEQSQMVARYKEDEHIRVTFVVEKRSENRLILCYINGIMSGAAQYTEDDDFSQTTPVGITIGSNFCTADVYNIRVYDNNLTRHQVLDNWIADTQNPDDKLARFLRNQIYDDYGRVVISRLPANLCYMVIQCTALPQFKDDVKPCNGYFVDLVNPERSFTFQNAEIDVQGTSSQYYYVKNYKIKFKNGFILSDGSTVTVYQMNPEAVPVDTFTMKADVASSEGAFNVVLAMLYHDLCDYKIPAQVADPRVRQTIEGFPMVMFWDNGSDVQFLGKYNFNNDKGTPEVFGFQTGDESWEILQNGTDRVGWHSADFSGSGWKDDFEARYPKKNTNTTRLQALAEWLVSTDTDQATGNDIPAVTYGGVEYTKDTAEYRLAKFSAELSDHFVEEAIIFYYLFTEIFLSIDQREKNAFPTYIASLDRWIVLFYDADSSCGTDNKGKLSFDYYLEDIDYTAGGDPIYNGQNSVLWKNLRQTRHEEITALYKDLRTRVSNGISYDSVIGKFEAHQGKWPEAIFNEDMYRKCLEPLVLEGDGTYIDMLQGKKEQWMKWWLYNRFRYLDSKYETGTSMTNRILIRAHQRANVFLTSYVNMYGRVYFNAAMVENRMERNTPYEFEWSASGAEDTVIGVNDADLLTSLGDLSPHMVESIDVSGAPHLTELKLGDAAEGYANHSLNSVTLGNNKLLRTLDLRNCVELTQSVDISGCTNIEEAYFDGTAISGVNLPNGGILKVLHLPGTIANLTIRNHKMLRDLVLPSYENITTLRLENNGDAINPMPILAQMPNGSRVRIIDFSYEASSSKEIRDFLTKLNSMRGMDENGNNTEKAQVSGSIHVETIDPNAEQMIIQAKTTYPSLVITYDEVRNFEVRFWYEDTLLRTIRDVPYGGSATYTGDTPTKPGAEVPDDWRFVGWSPDPSYVTDDMDCYAQIIYVGYTTYKILENRMAGEYVNDRVTAIGTYAFYSNKNLTAVSFANVTTVGERAFGECSSLASATFPLLETAGNSAFMNCGKLATVTMPKLTNVEYGAFSGTIIAEIPNAENVTNFGDLAFSKTKLTRVSLPSIIQVGSGVFSQCATLERIDFGSSMVNPNASVCGVRKDLFTNCTLLTTVIFRASTMLRLENVNAFTGTPIASGTGYIYVPSALVDSYKAATNWSTYASQIRAIEDYPDICGGE